MVSPHNGSALGWVGNQVGEPEDAQSALWSISSHGVSHGRRMRDFAPSSPSRDDRPALGSRWLSEARCPLCGGGPPAVLVIMSFRIIGGPARAFRRGGCLRRVAPLA